VSRFTVRECLLAAGPAHRAIVARTLGKPATASAATLAAILLDERAVAGLVAPLPPTVHERLLLALAGTGDNVVERIYRYGYGAQHRASATVLELEEAGLAFTIESPWDRRAQIPDDVAPLVLRAVLTPAASRIDDVSAPTGQIGGADIGARDAGAVWAALTREPARLKADGDLYARARPKLAAALPDLGLADGPVTDFVRDVRLALALDALRVGGFLRGRVDDRPGRNRQRDLLATADLRARLREHPDWARETYLRCGVQLAPSRLIGALLTALRGRTVALADLGAQAAPLLAHRGHRPPDALEATKFALAGVVPRWLCGEVTLLAGADGQPVAVHVEPHTVADPTAPAGPAVIAQSDFELLTLSDPHPADLVTLRIVGEPVSGRDRTVRLTRDSITAAAASGCLNEGVIPALEQLTESLPQNVRRSVEDWVTRAPVPVRLRSAIFVDTGRPELADELVAGPLTTLSVERIGPSAIAVATNDLDEVEAALRRAKVTLEPGLDRISGVWQERESGWEPAIEAWRARDDDAQQHRDDDEGKVASSLGQAAAARPSATPHGSLGTTGGPQRWHPQDDPADLMVLLDHAVEEQLDVDLVYRGARGTTQRRVSPDDVGQGRLHAWCHLRDEDRAFWLASIESAAVVAE
jgi:hypothetical protein